MIDIVDELSRLSSTLTIKYRTRNEESSSMYVNDDNESMKSTTTDDMIKVIMSKK